MRNHAKLVGWALVLAAGCSALWASVSFTPPGGKKMYVASLMLQPSAAAGKASATATMVCKTDFTTGLLTVQATGLDPKHAYTAWLVAPAKGGQKARQATGVGKAPYQLTVNAKGFGNLSADLPNCKAAVMETLEIRQHAGRDPRDTQQVVVMFTGDLARMLQGKKM